MRAIIYLYPNLLLLGVLALSVSEPVLATNRLLPDTDPALHRIPYNEEAVLADQQSTQVQIRHVKRLNQSTSGNAITQPGNQPQEVVPNDAEPIKTNATKSNTIVRATYRLRHTRDAKPLISFDLALGEEGVLVSDTHSMGSTSILFNQALGKLWLLNEHYGLVHSIPLKNSVLQVSESAPQMHGIKNGGDNAAQHTNDDFLLEQLSSTSPFFGFLRFQPCENMLGTQAGTAFYAEYEVQLWQCHVMDFLVETQWYSSDLNMVVKSESFDGFTEELTNLSTENDSTIAFLPTKQLKEVSLEQLMANDMRLSSYNSPINKLDAKSNHLFP